MFINIDFYFAKTYLLRKYVNRSYWHYVFFPATINAFVQKKIQWHITESDRYIYEVNIWLELLMYIVRKNQDKITFVTLLVLLKQQ